MEKRVFTYRLDNGLTILVCPKKFAPKVSLQLWYNVGSKHEATGEKGMAHFIEHMIFKGTQKMLSESDINLITHKLSGYTNAFTSFDYTGYLFDIPVANWDKVLPVFADCMTNCTFDQEHMNSEVKAVIQELKMYRDDFSWSLADGLVTAIFESHPYHHPIIGYKQDLWSLERETLVKFYEKYYIPQNAALVIVGDVEPEDVYKKVKESFGNIPSGKSIPTVEFFINDDIQAKTVTIYRDVQQAHCMLAFLLPGAVHKKQFIYEIIGYILANGKASRLHKILVEEKELAVSVSAMNYDLFDREVFFIEFKPKLEESISQIKEIILQEIQDIVQSGISEVDFRRALKFAQVDHQQLLENAHKQAYEIGKSFIATGDAEYPFTYGHASEKEIYDDVIMILKQYFRKTVCHQGMIINIPESEKYYLAQLQKESDELDTKILFGKERTSQVAPGKYVDQVQVEMLKKTEFAKPDVFVMDNGMSVLSYYSDEVDTVEVILDYKANRLYDPADKQGIGYLVSKLMLEGTKSYPHSSFMQEVESYGISIATTPGQIEATMLGADVEKGLDFIRSMIQESLFDARDVERVKDITKAKLKQFWDTPNNCISQIAAELVYKNHPYAYITFGSNESLDVIDREALFNFYQTMISPQEACLVIVGNFDKENIKSLVEKSFGFWKGQKIQDISFPLLQTPKEQVVDVVKNRDQITLAFTGLSVRRTDAAYDELSIFDRILSGGMSSRLFELREQSGLFYTVGGSLVQGAGREPGMLFIKTIVSKDRMIEAQEAILNCIVNSVDTVTDDEFKQAQEMVINGYPVLYESHGAMAATFLFLYKYKFAYDYFENKIDFIRNITKEQMVKAVKDVADKNHIITIRIGRL